KIPLPIQLNAVRLLELSLGRSSTIASESRLTRAGNRGNTLIAHRHPANEVILHFDEEHISFRIKAHFVRFIQLSPVCRTTVAPIAAFASPSNGLNYPALNPANHMIIHIAKVKCAIGPHREPIRVANLGVDRRCAISRVTSLARSDNCPDLPG